jgi:hypothetical protein
LVDYVILEQVSYFAGLVESLFGLEDGLLRLTAQKPCMVCRMGLQM